MKRNELLTKKKLLGGMPYSKSKLNEFSISELKMLASVLGVDSWQKSKTDLIKTISENQHELELYDERVEDFCEMCGKFVAVRQNAHIVGESGRGRINILKLCPTCHLMFDTRLKPRLYKALKAAGTTNLPDTWKTSSHHQAMEASLASPKRKLKK